MGYLNYEGVRGTCEFSYEEGIYYGKLCVKDLVNYEADTPSELYKEFVEAVKDYRELKKELEEK